MKKHQPSHFKAFFLAIADRPEHLTALNQAAHSDNVGVCLLKGSDDEAIAGYKINLDAGVKNTVLVYRDRKVTAKFVNWTPREAAKLKAAIDTTCASK